MEKGWLSGKSAMALGSFVLFSINQFFLELSTARIIVGVLFVLFGSASVFNGFRQYKHFLPLAVKEAEVYKRKSINIVMLLRPLTFKIIYATNADGILNGFPCT